MNANVSKDLLESPVQVARQSIVATSNMLAAYENLWDSALTGQLLQPGLDLCTISEFVKFHNLCRNIQTLKQGLDLRTIGAICL